MGAIGRCAVFGVCAAVLVGVVAAYDASLALRAAHYSKAIKCSTEALEAWNCGVACDWFPSGAIQNVTAIQDAQMVQYMVLFNADQNEIVVAFRGSSNIENFIEDAELKLKDYPECAGCKVHEGFYETYLNVSRALIANVADLLSLSPQANIIVTGHSMGAAQANLAALEMTRIFSHIAGRIYAYTIGTPRLGNPAFAAYAYETLVPGNHFYITNNSDPVPHLPFEWMGYLHFPREIWYKPGISASGFVVCNGTTVAEDPHCSNSVDFFQYNVEDHYYYLGVYTGCGNASSAFDQEERAGLERVLKRRNAKQGRTHRRGSGDGHRF